jgi:DNA-directed RNA polymerase specialized sigma24 family protein
MGRGEPHNDPRVLGSYEGLIFRTAQELRKPLFLRREGKVSVLPPVQMEHEDIEQVLRIKLWRALRAFQPERMRKRGETRREAEQRYVFMCLTDQGKDLRKRRRVTDLYIEDVAPADMDADTAGVQSRDRFEQRYLSSSEEEVYGDVEDPGFTMPATLTQLELEVVVLLAGNWKQAEVARKLSIEKREMEKLMRSVRAKLADWKPDVPGPQLRLLEGALEAADVLPASLAA